MSTPALQKQVNSSVFRKTEERKCGLKDAWGKETSVRGGGGGAEKKGRLTALWLRGKDEKKNVGKASCKFR